ncbi:MAG TPA: PKD domain-containing protein [Flavobacteriales bacterium]|nr:PKD domain-containing protein [Flavobacteriales bacterium]
MNSLRTSMLTAGLSALVSVNAQPFVLVVQGSIPDCAPNVMVEVTDLTGALSFVTMADGSCTFTATLQTLVPVGQMVFMGTCANGVQAIAQLDYQVNAPGDTAVYQVVLVCGAPVVDCEGIAGGGALPGQPCDDGNAATLLDTWGADCACAGQDSSQVVFDCLGVPNGPDQPGMPCIVDPSFPVLPIGIWSNDCQCVADSTFFYTDCLGILNGPNTVGSPCDDGNAATAFDLWDSACECVGYDSTQVTFDCLGIAFGNNLPGSPCIVDPAFPVLPIGIWSADCVCVADSTFGNYYDCLGIANGPDLPGTPCDDNDTSTMYDAWDGSCQCVGMDTTATTDCLGIINGPNQPGTPCFDPNSPFSIGSWDLSCTCVIDTTNAPIDCLGIPGGPNMPGLPCSLLPDSSNTVVGIWGPDCVCYGNTFDCLGEPGGSALPGSACSGTAADGSEYAGIWGSDCYCYGDSGTFVLDCLNQPNGPVLPGTPCIPVNEFPFAIIGTWSVDCICIPDTSLFYTDCLGIENGPNTIGSVCDTGDPNVLGYWNNACVCEAYIPPPCTAGFIVAPGILLDSAGVNTMQLWIWNTSYGGTGVYSYLWDFGDGNTSTDPWPMHDYDGDGPYNLCLTITDSEGCTNTFCDTLVVDENGMFGGLQGEENRNGGFSIRVMQGNAPTAVAEVAEERNLDLWPNPASDVVNLSLTSERTGSALVEVLDLEGRLVVQERRNLSAGETRWEVRTDALRSGIYLVRVQAEGGAWSKRFAKVDR